MSIICFLIYIPISIIKNDSILLILDLLLLLGLLITFLKPHRLNQVFAGRVSVFIFISIYLFTVLLSFMTKSSGVSINSFVALRNFLFGIGVFVVASAWITKKEYVEYLIKVFIWCIFFACLYGFRQLIFGYFPFELDRLAMMGASAKEAEILNRIRITSSFGDPLVFSFYTMLGYLALLFARKAGFLPRFFNTYYRLMLVIVFLALILSLTRAPLLGLVAGLILFYLLNNKIKYSHLLRVALIFCLGFGFLMIVNHIVVNELLANSEIPLLASINDGLQSFWSLFEFAFRNSDDPTLEFLTNQSQQDRKEAWSEGIHYLTMHPFGAGIKPVGVFSFSIGDVGLLSIGLQIGVFGLVSFLLILSYIGVQAFFDIRNIVSIKWRSSGFVFLSMWLAIIICAGISSIFDSSVIALWIWIIASVLLRYRELYSISDSREQYLKITE